MVRSCDALDDPDTVGLRSATRRTRTAPGRTAGGRPAASRPAAPAARTAPLALCIGDQVVDRAAHVLAGGGFGVLRHVVDASDGLRHSSVYRERVTAPPRVTSDRLR